MKKFLFYAFSLLWASPLCAQQLEPIKYGDMNHWVVRHIKESAVIGGKTQTLCEVGPDKTIDENKPYTNLGGSPWGTSNVMAKVSGIVKTNTSVYREKRGDGYCAKLLTHLEGVKVLGIVNIRVLAAGSLFLGDMKEPITGTKDGPKAMNGGIAFHKRPKALVFDYRVQTPGDKTRVKQTGFSKKQIVEGQDYAIAVLALQQRTEDSRGNITAKRIGTVAVRWGKSTNGWVNGASYEIIYGDARTHKGYDAELMGLNNSSYARNSKGESVPVNEIGWGKGNETPTHLCLQFASSHGGAYIGTVGNTLWVDNVKLAY